MSTKLLIKSLNHCQAVYSTAQDRAYELKASGILDAMTPILPGPLGDWGSQSKQRQGYAQFRGWLYAAVHAIASEAAGQEVTVAKLAGKKKPKPNITTVSCW